MIVPTPGETSSSMAALLLLLATFFLILGVLDAFSAGPINSNGQESPFKPPPLPISTTPYEVLGFDTFPADFTQIQRRYKELAKIYHPDRAVGPDAAAEERQIANSNFQRLNEAYDTLKSRQDEEEIEVIMMGGNGKRERRLKYKTSEKIREQNPNRINYDRIVELRERQNVKAESWVHRGIEYGRHNGDFGPVRRW
jgi:hypothetical protein